MGCTSAKSDPKAKPTETPSNTFEQGYDTIPYDNFIVENKRDPRQDYQFGNQLGSGTYVWLKRFFLLRSNVSLLWIITVC